MRLDRPVGTLLLLWPTLAALWLAADGVPPWQLIVIFTVWHFRHALGRMRDQRFRRPGLGPVRRANPTSAR
jgi:hypothetical protein